MASVLMAKVESSSVERKGLSGGVVRANPLIMVSYIRLDEHG
jgi:hypothetical protein